MENYFVVKELLGLNEGNLPVHKGMRQKRYQSIEKMLALMDVIKRIQPRVPTNILSLDPLDPEWEDEMNYLYPDYNKWYGRAFNLSMMYFIFFYNYQIIAYNIHWRAAHKVILLVLFYYTSKFVADYRKDILRANLFDEYVQLRADELIEQNKDKVRHPAIKKAIWFKLDLEETLSRAKRQSYTNTAEDFKDAELIIQDFIRRHTDETQALPLNMTNARIGSYNEYSKESPAFKLI